ncbi:MAG: HD domain-containing protein, partial [Desulfovibrionaceae bacterium]|nr:HD domain-containing protein [Desulfovibrionaceae bacterium]
LYNIRLKEQHSLRVLDQAQGITRACGFDLETAYLTHAAALFHDAGRFPQYAEYKTFSDADSENHARLGVRTLLRSDLLRGLSKKARRVIIGAVALHNVHRLPADLNPTLDKVTRVVRDSDKLDIIPVILEHLGGDRPLNPVVVLGLEDDAERYSPEILAQVMRRELAEYRLMRWANDFRLLLISWVYDLNHAWARRALLERGLLDRLFQGLPGDRAVSALRDQVNQDLKALIQGRTLA